MSFWTDIHIQVQIIYSACRYSNDNKNTQSMDSHRYHIKAASVKSISIYEKCQASTENSN
jgi:hypothetical protein